MAITPFGGTSRELRLVSLWLAIRRSNQMKRSRMATKSRRALARLVADDSVVLQKSFGGLRKRAMRIAIHGATMKTSVSKIVNAAAFGSSYA